MGVINQNLRNLGILLQLHAGSQKHICLHQIPACCCGSMDAVKMLHKKIIILKLGQGNLSRFFPFLRPKALFLKTIFLFLPLLQRLLLLQGTLPLLKGLLPISSSLTVLPCIFRQKQVSVCIIRIPVSLIYLISGILFPHSPGLRPDCRRIADLKQNQKQQLNQP